MSIFSYAQMMRHLQQSLPPEADHSQRLLLVRQTSNDVEPRQFLCCSRTGKWNLSNFPAQEEAHKAREEAPGTTCLKKSMHTFGTRRSHWTSLKKTLAGALWCPIPASSGKMWRLWRMMRRTLFPSTQRLRDVATCLLRDCCTSLATSSTIWHAR